MDLSAVADPALNAVSAFAGAWVSNRGGWLLQRAQHRREDVDRALRTLEALRHAYRVRRARPADAPDLPEIAALEDELATAAACVTQRVADAADAYVAVGRPYAARDETRPLESAEAASFAEVRNALVRVRATRRR